MNQNPFTATNQLGDRIIDLTAIAENPVAPTATASAIDEESGERLLTAIHELRGLCRNDEVLAAAGLEEAARGFVAFVSVIDDRDYYAAILSVKLCLDFVNAVYAELGSQFGWSLVYPELAAHYGWSKE